MKNKKISVILALLFCFGLVVAVPTFDSRMIKWNMCDSYNLTKYDCDLWWETPSNPYYISPANNISLEDYYNKTQLEEMFEDFYDKNQTKVMFNSGELIDSKYVNESELDGKFNELKQNFLTNFSERFLEKEDYEDDQHDDEKGSDGINDNALIFGGVVIAGLVGLFVYNNKKEQAKKKKTTNTSFEEKAMIEAEVRAKMEAEARAKIQAEQPAPTLAPPQVPTTPITPTQPLPTFTGN